ncbi:tRNA1(Val) (adenine(37)-N6)-methyltransferase [Fusobacterium sp. PH5-44]|uniref:tRNA1(Val) (adenine(37)-N6)-methyltransferase n=1 Tax=unclassified Fusobacterium TaxID=2648384 RepID=UPI003D25FB6B
MNEKELEAHIPLLKKGLSIIQRADYFNFSIDSLLISEFATITKSTNKILDLGCGNGVIPLFLSQKTNAKIWGIEIQKISSELAKRNIEINNLSDRISIIHDDINNWKKYFQAGYFDLIITNPPFFKYKGDISLNEKEQFSIARHEIFLTLEQLVMISSSLLKDKGYFSLVHRVDRMVEILEILKKYKIEPKKIRFCYTTLSKNAKILLIEGIKNGNCGLNMLPPLIINEKNGSYTEEVLQMFE